MVLKVAENCPINPWIQVEKQAIWADYVLEETSAFYQDLTYIQQIFNEFLQCTSNPGSCPHETYILIINQEDSEEYHTCTKVKLTVIKKCLEGISIPNFMAQVKAAGDLKDTWET